MTMNSQKQPSRRIKPVYIILLTLLLIALALVGYWWFRPAPPIDDPFWTSGATMPSARSEMPAALLDGLIYVPGGFGGQSDFAAYDPVADRWQELASLPDGRHHLMTVAHDGHIYAFGGGQGLSFGAMNNAWRYNPATDEWAGIAPLPEPRLAGAAVSLNDYIYLVGGTGGTDALLRYDPAADAWTALASLQQSREHTAAVVLDGEIVALAGRWAGVGQLNSVEIYNPVTDTWRSGPPMAVARGGFGAAVAPVGEYGRIVVTGGEVLTGARETLTSVEIYDPATEQWTAGPDLPVGLHGMPMIAYEDTLYVIGGSDWAGMIDNHGRVLIYKVE
jgi:N-acetylneuraminic acid mutarotase